MLRTLDLFSGIGRMIQLGPRLGDGASLRATKANSGTSTSLPKDNQ